jgi:hypothetical protein
MDSIPLPPQKCGLAQTTLLRWKGYKSKKEKFTEGGGPVRKKRKNGCSSSKKS